MGRTIHRSTCAALVLAAVALTGCDWKKIVVRIDDFEVNMIQGMELWMAEAEESEVWSEAARIDFGDCVVDDSGETIEYTMVDSQNRPLGNSFPAWVTRDDADGSVVIHLTFSDWREPPGWIRASTFNVVGDSDLSEEAVFL
jgi:hypothetical protein